MHLWKNQGKHWLQTIVNLNIVMNKHLNNKLNKNKEAKENQQVRFVLFIKAKLNINNNRVVSKNNNRADRNILKIKQVHLKTLINKLNKEWNKNKFMKNNYKNNNNKKKKNQNNNNNSNNLHQVRILNNSLNLKNSQK